MPFFTHREPRPLSLACPDGIRPEALRGIFTPETADGIASTRQIAELVRTLGLQPWKAPKPLPPIDEEDIVLVVWMAVESET
ncbi:MAG: hypothetical protein HY705_05660 [Gemmatimonadetes bacterium]|nr:hypothetical protein [Gemmatimonadota bacterium]